MTDNCCCHNPVEHEVLIWGPASEGEKMSSGKLVPMQGWVWTCTCRQSGFGYLSEDDAANWADVHIDL